MSENPVPDRREGEKPLREEPPVRKQHFRGFCERHSFLLGKVLLVLVIAVAALLVFTALGMTRTNVSSHVAELGLRNIGELSTQAGYFTSVQTIEKSRDVFGVTVPGTKSSYVYSYNGIVKAGVDFEDIRLEVDEQKHVIHVYLPEFRITSAEIDPDSFVLYNDGSNLFTSLKLEDVNRSNAEMIRVTKETAIKNGILDSARDNAQVLIRGFLSTVYDMNVYRIEFHYADKAGK